jgi:hypothetical protein
VLRTPGGLLLTPDAPVGAFTAVVFDQFGQPLDVAVAWTSTDPSVVSVDADGAVTVQADLGPRRAADARSVSYAR